MEASIFVGPKEPSVEAKLAAKRTAWAAAPEQLSTRHHIHLGDAREVLSGLDDSSAHLVVTSPPYWTLKSYDGEAAQGQLGQVENYGQFIEELSQVWGELFRILAPGGRVCIVVGDVCLSRKQAGRHRVVPLHMDITRSCLKLGFDYLTPILWYKIANMATEVGGNGAFLGKPYEPNAIIKNDVEYILLCRKPGGYRKPTPLQRALSIIDPADHTAWFRQIWSDVPGESTSDHPAPFPEQLAYRLISMFSFIGDTVVDPFAGSGTTTVAAIRAHRNSVGVEIEPTYYRGMKERFSQGRLDATVQFSGP